MLGPGGVYAMEAPVLRSRSRRSSAERMGLAESSRKRPVQVNE